jgi:hypothetical protein
MPEFAEPNVDNKIGLDLTVPVRWLATPITGYLVAGRLDN